MANRNSNDGQIKSQAELDREAARLLDNNEERLAKQFEVKDGKFLGLIPIPPELERTFGLIVNPLIAGIAGGAGDLAYKATTRLLGTSLLHGRAGDPVFAAKVAKTAVTGAVIAMDPILGAYALTRDRATNYMHLVHATKEIAEEIGAKPDNKVLRLAYSKYHQSWGDDLKKLIPGIVQVISTLPYAMMRYNEIWPESQLFAGAGQKVVVPAGGKKLTYAEALKEWKESHVPNYSGYDAEDISELKKHFLEQHGFKAAPVAGANGASTQHNPNAPFNIEDLLTPGKMVVALPAFAGFIAPDIRRWATKDDNKKNEKQNSYEMVEALRERVKAGSTSRVHDDVVRIFQQFEIDMHHKSYDSPQLAERTQAVTKAIVSGKLSVRGLFRLLDEDMVVSHAGGDRQVKSEEEIERSIQAVAAGTISQHRETSEEKFLSRFERSAIVEETIRENLAEFKPGPERDFFIALMPLEILENTGLTKKEIRESRINAQKHIYEHVAAGVLHLAAHNEEYLKAHDMTFKEIQYLQGVSKRIIAGDMEALRELVDNKKEGLVDLVAAGLIAEQSDRIGGNGKVWTDMVDQKPLEERIAEIKAKKEAAVETPHAERHTQHDGHVDRHQHQKSNADSHPNLAG